MIATATRLARAHWRSPGVALLAIVCVLPSVQNRSHVAASIRSLIDSRDLQPSTDGSPDRTQLEGLYRPDYEAVWIDARGDIRPGARDAIALLHRAAEEGLDPSDYRGTLFEALAERHSSADEPTPQAIAGADFELSVRFLHYLHDLRNGRVDPRVMVPPFRPSHDPANAGAMLREAAAKHRIEELAISLRPPFAQYELLRRMLSRYRTLARNSTAAPPKLTYTLRPDQSSLDADDLRRWLALLGDLPVEPAPPPSPLPPSYSGTIVEGVKAFQRRHGLSPDGVVGRATQAALAVPLASRVREIELALERFRWLPDLPEERVLFIGIPMFRVWAWDNARLEGAPAFSAKVIVGRAERTPTPVFTAVLREVIFRPAWNVPSSIMRGEIIPILTRDPDYLRRENMEIVRADGGTVAFSADTIARLRRGELRLRQRPGPRNALGLIKFEFPNEYDVYMHGTPALSLFARDRRDFSHGCVRVEDPIGLAEWVLKDDFDWSREQITDATDAVESGRVPVKNPIRVVFFYTTAFVSPETGTLAFAEDIYRQNDRLDRALSGSSPRSSVTSQRHE